MASLRLVPQDREAEAKLWLERMQHLFGHKNLTDKELADLASSLALLADSEQKKK